MDLKAIGLFLAQQRKERGWTQEQLGERIGVTNKTVSRWENGNYLPPVDALQELSGLYGLSINEILSATKLEDGEYREKAEENIQAVLRSDHFSAEDRKSYYKKKWQNEHRFENILVIAALLAGYVINLASGATEYAFLFGVFTINFSVIRYHSMMAYVDGKLEPDARKDLLRLKRLRIAVMIILCIGIWITCDLGYNYFASLPAELNDGLTIRGVFAGLVFGDDNWSRAAFLRGFVVAGGCTAAVAVADLVLTCLEKSKN